MMWGPRASRFCAGRRRQVLKQHSPEYAANGSREGGTQEIARNEILAHSQVALAVIAPNLQRDVVPGFIS